MASPTAPAPPPPSVAVSDPPEPLPPVGGATTARRRSGAGAVHVGAAAWGLSLIQTPPPGVKPAMPDALPLSPAQRPALIAAWLLAGAGTLPFLAGAAGLLLRNGEWIGAVQVYGAVIASFVCGIHWGAALFAAEGLALRLFLVSNIAALLGWVAALLPTGPGFLLLAVLFAALLTVDRHLWRAGLWPLWFWRLRGVITAVVVGACLVIGAVA